MPKKKRQVLKKDEIRDYKKSGHPTQIYERIGHDFKGLGITHSPITDGVNNINLINNPNKNDKKKAYIRPVVVRDRVNYFGPIRKDMKLSKKDKKRIREFMK